jgi:hypothetical protein
MAHHRASTRPVPTVIDRHLVAVLVLDAQRLGSDARSDSSKGAAQHRERHPCASERRDCDLRMRNTNLEAEEDCCGQKTVLHGLMLHETPGDNER